MFGMMRATTWLVAGALLGIVAVRGNPAPCPGSAAVDVMIENASAEAVVVLDLTGDLVAPSATCSGSGETAYATRLTCAGSGTVRCGRIGGLRPGAWVHRLHVAVSGSDPQVQRQRSVVVAAEDPDANTVSWTIYPRTFVVRQATGTALTAALDGAAAFTGVAPGAFALVTFDPAAFPGADDPRLIRLRFTPGDATRDVCAADVVCPDGAASAYCFAGSRVIVDALDVRGRPGAVVVGAGTCARSLIRLTGSDNVLRGLELRGSEATDNLDTMTIAGPAARRNRIERCIVRGPRKGDAIDIEDGAGTGAPDDRTMIVASEISDASDKGLRVSGGGRVTIADSCIHDNRSGGIQSSHGGDVAAVRNVVQHSRLAGAQHGLLVGEPGDAARSLLATDGNVVRFSGARGVSVVDAASAVLVHDVIVENQFAGVRIETTVPDVTPVATLRGVALWCNHKRVTGTCTEDATRSCVTRDDCRSGSCAYPPEGEPDGFGAVLVSCTGCAVPLLDLGTGGRDAGRNALTQNANPSETRFGVNLVNNAATTQAVPALGNQWEWCGSDARCDVPAVQARDLRPPTIAADIGTPTGPRGGPPPVITRIVPTRPRAGDFVRVYNGSLEGVGGTFNAIDGAACTRPGGTTDLPIDRCSPENPRVAEQNRALGAGDRVTITLGGESFDADVHAVTPTMLIFRMPVDCFAPGTLVVTRGAEAVSPPAILCDPASCADRPAGAPCGDGDVCTTGERCDGAGACVGGDVVTCAGPCLTGECDPRSGCVVADTDPICDDGNPCTVDRCVAAATCTSTAAPDGAPCLLADRCSVAASCRGGVCAAGGALDCDDGDFCTDDSCDPAAGCRHVAVTGVRLRRCRVDELRALLSTLPGGGARLRRRLARRLDRVDAWLARAAAAARHPRRVKRARARARAQLRRFIRLVRARRRALGGATERRLARSAKAAIANLGPPT
jgi:hypothetical protein